MQRIGVFLVLLFVSAAGYSGEPDFLTRVRRLTFEGRRAGEGYFDSTGGRLILQSEREEGNPFYQIYILNLASGESHRVSPGTGKTTCSFFHPSGEKVLFASTHLDPKSEEYQKVEIEFRASGKERRYSWDYDEHFDIFEAGVDGSNGKPLTTAAGYDAEGSYSPDGTKIAFCSMRDAYPIANLSDAERKIAETDLSFFGEIYIMNADGTDQRRLTRTPGYDGGPFFMPGGDRIVWRRFDEKGLIADIFTMKIDGSDERRITDFGAMSWAPYFHPTGKYAIFASNKLGFANFELFVVDAAGTKKPVRVSFTDGFDGLPVFSPDGETLAWTSTRHGGGREGGQIYMGKWNHEAALAALASAPARDGGPAPTALANPATPAPSFDVGPEILEKDLRAWTEFLASEALEGRLTGSDGERAAAQVIDAEFRKIGLRKFEAEEKTPEGPPNRDGSTGSASFMTDFEFTAGFKAGAENRMNALRVEGNPHAEVNELIEKGTDPRTFEPLKDFTPLSISETGEVEGVLAFAGYGLVVPGADGKFLYDSYGDLDVAGKMVLALRYVPEGVDAETRQTLNRYAGLRYKALQARERGAAGLIVVSGPNSPAAGELMPLGMEVGAASSGIPAISITGEAAHALLASSGRKLAELQTSLDSGESKETLTLYDTVVRMNVDLIKETRRGRNVIGFIPPAGGVKPDSQYVVIGAHYDHLGRGGGGNSLARKGEENQIHYGADDNASGVAAMLEIAARAAADPAAGSRGLIFAAWSGEEEGLLGSSDFCKTPPVPIESIVAYLNMDMVGRLKDNKLTVQGVGSSGDWRRMLERKNVMAGFDMTLMDDPYLPTDVMSFYLKKIPSLQFFTGAHEDYHRPTDTAGKIDYEGLERIAGFVAAMAKDLAGEAPPPQYAEVPRGSAPAGGRESMRAYLGTIPDYAEEVVGVKLAGVQSGGPADKAGLKGGDVIVEFAGQAIKNIYDYTYALDAVKIGVPIQAVVTREGQKLTMTLTPEMRK